MLGADHAHAARADPGAEHIARAARTAIDLPGIGQRGGLAIEEAHARATVPGIVAADAAIVVAAAATDDGASRAVLDGAAPGLHAVPGASATGIAIAAFA